MTLATHICPRCRRAVGEHEFITPDGDRRKWCAPCRATYRDRLTKLHASKKPTNDAPANTPDAIAKAEGYGDHVMARALALSHIAGAKRALAIRDGSSWRGKKAWRAYYEAKRELLGILTLQSIGNLSDEQTAEMMAGEDEKTDFGC